MMKTIKIIKPDKSLKGTIHLPSSKSISNRLLIMQALSGTDFGITNLSTADDTLILQKLLTQINLNAGQRDAVVLDCSNAGTDLRFLTAFLATKPGRWVLTGTDRMKQRPIGELVENLKKLGASIEYLGTIGFPPLLVKGRKLFSTDLQINAGLSSQFISALMMIAPGLPDGLTLNIKGYMVSEPYIDMTVSLMKECGARVRKWKHKIRIEPGTYYCSQFTVESDWSAASFWYQAAALADEADLELPGLSAHSLQGDSVLARAYTLFGVKSDIRYQISDIRYPASCIPHPASCIPHPASCIPHPASCIPHPASCIHLSGNYSPPVDFTYDFTHHPDLALPMIATCAALGLRGRFEGLKSLAIKESDRVYALTSELTKLGCKLTVTTGDDPVIEIHPSKLIFKPETIIDTYRDHRMAMTFAMLALKTGSIRIADPDVVAKSYPEFWEDLGSVGFQIKW
ncbi:MAG: 3-phosphoshikimate 1-carboxyvinyltransferase [Bacteroidales bacterium]